MTDREKVIKGLECCQECDGYTCRNLCPYHDKNEPENQTTCTCRLAHDALALLKAQEPRMVHVTADINHRKIGECPNCGKLINSGDYMNFCGQCGQVVKWE